jgi:dolichyl-phosphate beta-glucosyltransferase
MTDPVMQEATSPAGRSSVALRLPIYDTQCGAKPFRATPEMRALFAASFVSSWCFDVELIARLSESRGRSGAPGPEEVIYELRLNAWRDAGARRCALSTSPRGSWTFCASVLDT